MRRLAWMLALLVLTPPPLQAQEELEAWLQQRLDQPLDLRSVEADELARLPWLDLASAESIVGLREAGGLRDWNSLRSLPGLDAATLLAIAPFVELQPDTRQLELQVAARASDRSQLRDDVELRSRAHSAQLRGWARADANAARFALSWTRANWEFELGALRGQFGQNLLIPKDGTESRADPLGRPRTPALNPALSLASAEPIGCGLAIAKRLVFWLRPHQLALGVVAGGSTRWRLGARLAEQSRLLVLGMEHRGLDFEWGIAPSLATVVVARTRLACLGGELGIDLSQAGQAIAETNDPLSGRRLDRARSGLLVVQSWHLRAVSQRWSYRQLRSERSEREDELRCQMSGRWSGRSVDLRARAGRTPDSALQAALSLRVSHSLLGGLRQSWELRYEPREDGDRRLLAWRWFGGGSWSWQIGLAHSDGGRSAFDAQGLPGGGSLLRWLAPDATGLTMASSWHGIGTWLDFVRLSDQSATRWRGGLSWRAHWGGA